MWLKDLEKAVNKVNQYLGTDANCVCINKIIPAADGGIVFYLSDFTIIKWCPNGAITRKDKDAWRK